MTLQFKCYTNRQVHHKYALSFLVGLLSVYHSSVTKLPSPFPPRKNSESLDIVHPNFWTIWLWCYFYATLCTRCHAQQHFSFLTYDICFFNISADQNKSSKFASLILLRGKTENNRQQNSWGLKLKCYYKRHLIHHCSLSLLVCLITCATEQRNRAKKQ